MSETTPKPSKPEPRRQVVTEPTEFPVRVRTTIQPELDLEVDSAEYRDLKVQGLLLPGHDGTTTSLEG